MLDFEIQRCTRQCGETHRELQPGEPFYSVLISEGGQVVRQDFSEAAWHGPPAESLGWWKSRMPEATSKRVNWAPNDVVLHYFDQLQDKPAEADLRYILGLLMIRRRIVRLEDTERSEEGEVLVVYCPRNEQEYRVPVVSPGPARAEEIQNFLGELLFADAA